LATLAIVSPALLGTLSDESAYSGFELVVEVFRVCPDDVWELARVEVKVLHRRALARPNNRYVEAHCETGLEVHATAHLLGLACEISYQEARATNLSNNLVVHFVQVVMLLVYAPWFVS
jgi:hypothetical protein